MSLYLQIEVGEGHYLLEATRILELRTGSHDTAGEPPRDNDPPAVDLRQLFGESAAATGYCVVYAQASGKAAALLVDRVDGLVDLGDDEFCPLPPIGPLGALIDAISTRLADRRPMLRLRGERVLAMPMPEATSPAG